MTRFFDPAQTLPSSGPSGFGIDIFKRSQSPARSLVLMIHGLGGDPYKTWRNWARFARANSEYAFDVGTVSYLSFQRRVFRPKVSKLTDVIALLAEQIRDLQYESIVLVCHSLGGILAKGVVHWIHNHHEGPSTVVEKLSGMILLGTPGGGSLYAAIPLTGDLKVLGPNAPSLAQLNQFFTDFVDLSVTLGSQSNKSYGIPTFAGLATLDAVVGDDSAANRVPSSQIRHFERTHSGLAKADAETDEVFDWVMQRAVGMIAAASGTRARMAGGRTRPVLIYDFEDHAGRSITIRTLQGQLKAIEAEHSILHRRRNTNDKDDEVVLEMNLLDDSDGIDVEVRRKLDEACSRQTPSSILAIARLGPQAQNTLASLRQIIPRDKDRFIDAIPSIEELAMHFRDWLSWAVAKGKGVELEQLSGPTAGNVVDWERQYLYPDRIGGAW